jgi:hypothetical protein
MKKKYLYLFLGLLFLFYMPQIAFAQAEARTQEICKHFNITDTQVSGRIKQACDEYYAKIAEADKQTDETQKSVKKLRANQNYALKIKSLLVPEQKLQFDKFNKKEQDSFINKPNQAKKEVKKVETKTKKVEKKKITKKKVVSQ